MALNLLTISKRATLGRRIKELTETTKKRIAEAFEMNNIIEDAETFSIEQKKYNRELTLIGVVSLLEQYINFLHTDFLECFPSKISRKQLDVNLILEEGSVMSVLSKKAQEKVTDLAYGKFNSMVGILQDNLELTARLNEELVEQINEIKCTRDVYSHTNGRSNLIYLQKAGKKARAWTVGAKLEIDKDYFNESSGSIVNFIEAVYTLIPNKFKELKKKFVFKQMWEATCLSDRVKFEEAWRLEEKNDMVRPVDMDSDWGFSHSEVQVYYFFLDIYSDKRRVDYKYLFSRWSPETNEYQIVQSWLNSPFYF